MADKENIVEDDYEDDEKMLCKAMLKAKEAFEQYFMNIGIDAAYFEIELSGYVLDVNFKRMNQIVMKTAEDNCITYQDNSKIEMKLIGTISVDGCINEILFYQCPKCKILKIYDYKTIVPESNICDKCNK